MGLDMEDLFSNISAPLPDTLLLNVSLKELDCYLTYHNLTPPDSGGQQFCHTTWDGLSCWTTTPASSSAVIPCFPDLNGVQYDTSENASRLCHDNGTWAARSDYSQCRPLIQRDESFQVLWDVKEASTIYYVGYGLSMVAVTVALWIFLYFKDLRCLRNTIHTNLMVTYFLTDLIWMITASLQSENPSHHASKAACVLFIFLTYLMCTNFFWMFVEGLYLYILVVKTFSVEMVRPHVYIAVGWGLPAVVMIVWASVKTHFAPAQREAAGCPWQSRDHYDYIFMCPVILVLVINIFFLGEIMWVLITKLRAATTAESKQYRKAAKALLVLIPLLGVTYVVVIVTPSHRTARVVFAYAQATLLSTQGLTVAVLYCFLNGEVRKSLRHHLEQWKTQREIIDTPRHSLGSRPSHHGDMFRLYGSRGVQDRESVISFTTSTTWVSNTCSKCTSGPRHSNGSYGLVPVKDDPV